jgi:hypothetical protein
VENYYIVEEKMINMEIIKNIAVGLIFLMIVALIAWAISEVIMDNVIVLKILLLIISLIVVVFFSYITGEMIRGR